jgi:hypothetical protein
MRPGYASEGIAWVSLGSVVRARKLTLFLYPVAPHYSRSSTVWGHVKRSDDSL